MSSAWSYKLSDEAACGTIPTLQKACEPLRTPRASLRGPSAQQDSQTETGELNSTGLGHAPVPVHDRGCTVTKTPFLGAVVKVKCDVVSSGTWPTDSAVGREIGAIHKVHVPSSRLQGRELCSVPVQASGAG